MNLTPPTALCPFCPSAQTAPSWDLNFFQTRDQYDFTVKLVFRTYCYTLELSIGKTLVVTVVKVVVEKSVSWVSCCFIVPAIFW